MGRRGPPPRYRVQTKVPVTAPIRDALDQLAEAQDRLLSELVREALDQHLAAPGGPDEAHPGLLTGACERHVTVMLRPTVAEQLAELAEANHRTVGPEVRIALQRYLVGCGIDGHRDGDSLLTA